MKMTNILATWIVIQLIVIWATWTELMYQFDTWKYDCSYSKNIPPKWKYNFIWIMFPLVFFTTESENIKEYCKEQKLDNTLFDNNNLWIEKN